jgi:hypothetical protein
MRRISWLFGAIAMILCIAPATVLVGREVHERADVNWPPVLVVVAIAAAGILVARTLRKVASDRYLRTAIRRREAGVSPTFAFTLVAWVLAGTAFGFAVGTWFIATNVDKPVPDKYLRNVTEYPLPILFLFAGLAVLASAGYYSWGFRKRHEFPVLRREGIAIVAEPGPPQPVAVTKMWLTGMLIDASLFAGAIVPRLLSDDDRPSGAELATGVFGVLAGPAIISFVILMFLLVNWSTRRSAFDALRQPTSIAAIGIVLVGFALDGAGQQVAGAVVGLVGVLIGSATLLNIMDRGSQPWMGYLFLAGSYVYGYLTAPDGHSTLPQGVTGWVVAVLAAAYTIQQAWSHGRDWTRLVRPSQVAMPPQPLQ